MASLDFSSSTYNSLSATSCHTYNEKPIQIQGYHQVKAIKFLKTIFQAGDESNSSQPTMPNDAQGAQLLEQGLSLEKSGEHEKALALFHSAAKFSPDNANAHYHKGLLLLEMGNLNEALSAFERTYQLKPDSYACCYNLGITALQLGDVSRSIEFLKRTLALRADYVDAELALGIALRDDGLLTEAMESLRNVIRRRPDDVQAHYHLAGTLLLAGDETGAEAQFLNCTRLHSNFLPALLALTLLWQKRGQHEQALQHLLLAHQRCGDTLDICRALGNAYRLSGQFEKALPFVEKAVMFAPNSAELQCTLGLLLHRHGKPNEAREHYQRALTLDPEMTNASNNLGILYLQCGEFRTAATLFEQLLTRSPNDIDILSNLGLTLTKLGDTAGSEKIYRRILTLNPHHLPTRSKLLFLHNYGHTLPPSELFDEAKEFGRLALSQSVPWNDWNCLPTTNRRLKIGFVSADLYSHPVGYFSEGVFKHLHESFQDSLELFVYSNNHHSDALSERIKIYCASWQEIGHLTDALVAEKIRADRIDILIDLAGHTGDNRLGIFAYKPAPVQVSWLGYFATTGLPTMDYLIADPWSLPKEAEVDFTETIWRLPETRLCFTPPELDIPPPVQQTRRVTFGCFNDLTKLNDTVIGTWAEILNKSAGSQLMLKNRQLAEKSMQHETLRRFASLGIASEQLILEGPSSRIEYLAAYNRVDICLDPFPYTGGTTTAEALWMGVPVLTLEGRTLLERQGVALLANIGLQEWIARDVFDYAQRAVRQAENHNALKILRSTLRQKFMTSPIADNLRFARHFNDALLAMWHRWCCESSHGRTDVNNNN